MSRWESWLEKRDKNAIKRHDRMWWFFVKVRRKKLIFIWLSVGSYRHNKAEQISTYVENFIPTAFRNVASLNIDDIPIKEAIAFNPYTNFHQTLKHILAQNEIDF